MFHFKKPSNIINTIFEVLYENNLELNTVCQIHIKNFLISSFKHMCFRWHTLRFHVRFSLKAVRISDYIACDLRVFECSEGSNLGITPWYIQRKKNFRILSKMSKEYLFWHFSQFGVKEFVGIGSLFRYKLSLKRHKIYTEMCNRKWQLKCRKFKSIL